MLLTYQPYAAVVRKPCSRCLVTAWEIILHWLVSQYFYSVIQYFNLLLEDNQFYIDEEFGPNYSALLIREKWSNNANLSTETSLEIKFVNVEFVSFYATITTSSEQDKNWCRPTRKKTVISPILVKKARRCIFILETFFSPRTSFD